MPRDMAHETRKDARNIVSGGDGCRARAGLCKNPRESEMEKSHQTFAYVAASSSGRLEYNTPSDVDSLRIEGCGIAKPSGVWKDSMEELFAIGKIRSRLSSMLATSWGRREPAQMRPRALAL